MAGGFAEAYNVSDPLLKSQNDGDSDLDVSANIRASDSEKLPVCNSDEHQKIGFPVLF